MYLQNVPNTYTNLSKLVWFSFLRKQTTGQIINYDALRILLVKFRKIFAWFKSNQNPFSLIPTDYPCLEM